MVAQGRLIVFEGGEGAGKSTQIARSHAWLQTTPFWQTLQQQGIVRELVMTREPGGTPLGKGIRELLLAPLEAEPMGDRTELLLYAADRAQHVDHFLRPQLAQGGVILCDRFVDSTIAYQGHGRGLDLGLIQQLNQIATAGLTSDLTLWLDVPAEVGLSRTQKRGTVDRMEQNTLTFHQRVWQGFETLAQQHPDRTVRINAHQDFDAVFADIQAALTAAFERWYGEFLDSIG